VPIISYLPINNSLAITNRINLELHQQLVIDEQRWTLGCTTE